MYESYTMYKEDEEAPELLYYLNCVTTEINEIIKNNNNPGSTLKFILSECPWIYPKSFRLLRNLHVRLSILLRSIDLLISLEQ